MRRPKAALGTRCEIKNVNSIRFIGQAIEYEARRLNISFEEQLAKRGAATPAGRVGDPKEFGDACAFLCAASSGFIVGQNLLLDGGAFNSTMG